MRRRRCLADVAPAPATKSNSAMGTIVPLVIVGVGGIAAWKGISYLQQLHEEKETDKARAGGSAAMIDTMKTKQRIENLRDKSWVSGVNSYKKNVRVNILDQARELINDFYLTMQNADGTTGYIYRSDINPSAVVDTVFQTPLKELAKMSKIYFAYTQRNILEDAQKRLPLNDYTKVKTVFGVGSRAK